MAPASRPLLSEYIKRKRTEIILPCLQGDVLDLGCGFTTVPLYPKNSQHYCGVDRNMTAIQWGRQKYPHHQFIQADIIFNYLHLDSEFDTILLIAVLEHMEDPTCIINEIKDFLSPAGRLIITTPIYLGGFIHAPGSKIGLKNRYAVEDHKRF